MNTDDTMPDGWPYSKAKTALIRSAAQVMQERGPRAATLKNISQRAGVTEPAIFRHFDGVDGVFEGLFTTVEFFYEHASSFYSHPDVKGIERFEKAYQKGLDMLLSYKDFAYLLLFAPTIFQEYEELYTRSKALKSRHRTHLTSCFKEAAKLGQIRSDVDVDTMTSALMGQCHMLFSNWLETEDSFNLKDRSNKLWKETKKLLEKRKAS